MTAPAIVLVDRFLSLATAVLICGLGTVPVAIAQPDAESPRISRETLYEKTYAYWLGQTVGNIYGLVHENKYVEEPGPRDFPYGYDYRTFDDGRTMTDRMREIGGAFSDDDTDFEYLYLQEMEEHGPEPTYRQLAEAWKYHVRGYVWIANRAALTLMHAGYTPPATGQKVHNHHWFQIDPQLINEIWAATAPGMIDYAVAKSKWAAHITNDDWGVEPTMFYGALYSAAFFESDVQVLINRAKRAMPTDSRFVETVRHMEEIYADHPDDIRQARKEMADRHYRQADSSVKTIWNANLNGAAGILSLLYGEGNFQRTLDLSNYFGFDSDNQAASMCGVLAVAKGPDTIPDSLLRPVEGWEKPFNDRYINRTRYDMPDARFTDMAERTVIQAENLILEHGGEKYRSGGSVYYEIPSEAAFTPPIELHDQPLLSLERGQDLDYTYYAGGETPSWSVVDGTVPPGLEFDSGHLTGAPTTPGEYAFTVAVAEGTKDLRETYDVMVAGENLAPRATDILVHPANTDQKPSHLERLRDGGRAGSPTYYSRTDGVERSSDFYGYKWATPQQIGLMRYRSGDVQSDGGWFLDLEVEYRDGEGNWRRVDSLSVTPQLSSKDSRFVQPNYVVYTLQFPSVRTTAVRIVGPPGNGNSEGPGYTSVCELGVYPPLDE